MRIQKKFRGLWFNTRISDNEGMHLFQNRRYRKEYIIRENNIHALNIHFSSFIILVEDKPNVSVK